MRKENDQRSKLRLKRVSIFRLFGRYDHEFDLSLDDRVTILHGPNGVGKTAVLRLLFAIFSGRTFQVFSIRFSKLTLAFESGEVLEITRVPVAEDIKAEHIVVRTVDGLGLQDSWEGYVDSKILTKFASSIARRAPWLERIEDEVWIDRRTGERLTAGELLNRFEMSDPDVKPSTLGVSEQLRPIARIQGVMQEFARRVDVHIIETQRLLSKVKKERRVYREPDDGDVDVQTTVNECAEELRGLINTNLTRYALESQRRDQSFPMRLLRLAEFGYVSRYDLEVKLLEISNKRSQLAEVGLLVDKLDPYDSFESQALASADPAQLRVIDLYAGDTQHKLKTLDEILQVTSLFFHVVNSRFRHKRLALDKEKGLVAFSDTGDEIRLDGLSSGEQHQLVMFYDLLFRVKTGSLVLIDEPELSLHVTWQKTLLESLLEIAREKELEVLIATHSPYIVGGHVWLLRDLSARDYADGNNQF